ncbi:hypothetical protein I5Q34_26925 [Streptomyces sp. AV19]|uniref:hypothetical protein n=1 Tax=Streptomyces sp. AV19 TaxID=2793068 RepID=UPI0018FEB34C|nr:hypothetical protein [Streptomyces sp. AV19]MBH1937860.1 hypothetical protein [Streptomyces sp. AV19]MDG4534048.1 PadR family transcriptional regulator [Streptomyces sp. AV19]
MVEVLRLLLSVPADDPLWAGRIAVSADVGKSTVSQVLARLTALGWVTRCGEEGPHPGRPARVFYTLSPKGRRQAEVALAARDTRSRRNEAGDHQEAGEPSTRHAPETQPPAPRMAGHWPIRFPTQLGTTADEMSVREEDEIPEGLAALQKACTTLSAVNRSLTKEVFAQAVADPAHARHYERLVRAIIVQSSELRKRAQRAPHARTGGGGNG